LVGVQAAGGVLGLIGWAILPATGIMDWRTSVAVASILAVISATLLYLRIPKASKLLSQISSSIKMGNVRSLLLDKSLIIIGVLLLGSQASLEQTLGFMPLYLQENLKIEPAIAGLVGSLTLMAALAGSPIIGWIYDKNHDLFRLVLVVAGVLLVGVSINYTNTLSAAVASVLIVGFAGGGLFTLLSNSAQERVSRGKGKHSLEYTTLSVNWVHCIALMGTFWAPILFSASVLEFGYSTAWPMIGAISFAIILIFSLIGRSHRSNSTRR
jgi:MFS family permease